MHTKYYNSKGDEIPSVTTILGIVNKPELVRWAHYMGTKNMSIDDLLIERATFGTNVHSYLESYFEQGDFIYERPDDTDEFKKVINNFKWFMKGKESKCVFSEVSRSNELFGGTFDFYGMFNGKKMIIDYKTSKSVYTSHLLQLGGYYELIKDELDIELGGVLIINKKECRMKEITIDKLKSYGEMFNVIAELYNMHKDRGFI